MDKTNNERIKEEFISTLSHEIRTPLTSIKGFSKTMLENWEALDDERKKKFLTIISEQSQRLINLVENVLNVSKIDSGNTNTVLKKTDMNTAINSVISMFKVNNKDYNFNFVSSSKEFAMADLNKLQQVLINIFDNAIKYSKDSKDIDITLKNDKKYIIVSIKNYGIEIEKEYHKKIFDKFYRINSYINNSAQGSGLGLYIVKKMLNDMGGEVEVQSGAEPKYCEFKVYLPLYEVESAAKRALEGQ